MATKSKANSESDLPKLAAPARRALDNAGIRSLSQLAMLTTEELKALHGIGPNAIALLIEALKERRMKLRS